MSAFTTTEMTLSRMLGKRIAAGMVTAENAHVTGSRTVGPCVTIQVGDEGFGFYTNATPSLYLGRTAREAATAIGSLGVQAGK